MVNLRREATPFTATQSAIADVWRPCLEFCRQKVTMSFWNQEKEPPKQTVTEEEAMNILRAGSTAEPHSSQLIRNPLGNGRGPVRFLMVVSGGCWWRGPQTCTPSPQKDYPGNWMFKQPVWEESSAMQHWYAPNPEDSLFILLFK